MNDDEDQKLFDEYVNQALDDSVDELPVDIQRKLTQIRTQAAHSNASSTWLELVSSWKTASAFSVALTVTLSWIYWPVAEQVYLPDSIEITPFAEVLQEDLQMLEDMEFVYWLAEEVSSETATL